MISAIRNALATEKKLSSEEERFLIKMARSGSREAMEDLILMNIRLVAREMQPYRDCECYDDLFQEGMIGLWTAISRFENSKGTRLSSYAVPYIRGYILNFIRKNTFIKIPPDLYFKKDNNERAANKTRFQRCQWAKKRILNLDEEQEILNDSGFDEENSSGRKTYPLINKVFDPFDLEETVIGSVFNDFFEKMIEGMRLSSDPEKDKRNKDIVRLYYGLDGITDRSASEIARDMKLSSSRVDQIIKEAKRRIWRIYGKEIRGWL